MGSVGLPPKPAKGLRPLTPYRFALFYERFHIRNSITYDSGSPQENSI